MNGIDERERGSAEQAQGVVMKEGWPTKSLGDVCQLISGQHIDAKDYNLQMRGIGYLTGPSDFGPLTPVVSKWTEHPKITAKRGDLLITVKGSGIGKVNLLDDAEVAISRQLMAVRVTGAEPRFIHAILNSSFDHFQSLSTGAAIPGISREQVLALTFTLPPLPEQQRIVALLDEAFAGLATAKANAERNLQNARAIFESHLQSVFSQRGEGWVEKSLESLAEIRTGKRDANHQDENGPFPFYTCAFGQFKSPTFSFDGPSIILPGNGANVGKIFFYNGKFEAYQRTYVVNELNHGIIPRFLYFCFTANWSRWIATKQLGSATNYIVVGDLKAFPVPMPPLEVQEATVKQLELFAEATQHLTRLYERKLAALEELKKALLHQAFNGEL